MPSLSWSLLTTTVGVPTQLQLASIWSPTVSGLPSVQKVPIVQSSQTSPTPFRLVSS